MTGNLLTLAEARDLVRKYVDNGTCKNSLVDARLAEAEERLWPKGDWRNSLRRIRSHMYNQIFPLPWEVEKILKVAIDGCPSYVMGQSYEYLGGGLGDLDMRGMTSGTRDAVYMGEFPVQFDIPVIGTHTDTERASDTVVGPGYVLAAFSPYVEDADLTITIRGVDLNNDEIFTTRAGVWSPGEVVKINHWAGGVQGSINGTLSDVVATTIKFRQVIQVSKLVTKGPVTLYAIDPVTNGMWLLSKMTPYETNPSYQRYRLTNMSLPKTISTSTENASAILVMLVKIRFKKAIFDDDIMSIQNRGALKFMTKAITAENSNDLNGAAALEQTAVRLLIEQKSELDMAGGMPTVIDIDRQLSNASFNRGYYI